MKINFRWKTTLAVIILLSISLVKTGYAQQKFEKKEFFDVMSSGEVDAIDKQIELVTSSSLANKEGYEGALLMRKAGKVHGAKKKLGFFKEGRIKLETAIVADPDNAEFRFLRLAIEENAPKIVKYHNDIEKDKLLIQKNFKSLPATVQHAITDYSKKSKVLHAEDL